MSTEFVVTCASKSFKEWLENLDTVVRENKDMTIEQIGVVQVLREDVARFNEAFKGRIAP